MTLLDLIGANPAVEVAHDCAAIFCWPDYEQQAHACCHYNDDSRARANI